MHWSFQGCLLFALTFAIQWFPVASAGSQYCHQNKPDFCVALATRQNASTQASDLYLTISNKPGRGGGGWTAIGIGKAMAGALMFILYSNGRSNKPTVSIRTANGHVMPKLVGENAPVIDVRYVALTESGDYLVKAICYSCNTWPGLNFGSNSQPWNFATNTEQVFQTAEDDARLMVHQVHGHFAVDMQLTLLKANEPIPSINGHQSFGAWESKSQSVKETWLSAVQIHGLIMSTCFMGIFGFGIVMIRTPSTRGLKLHWTAQLTASLLSTGSAAYMLSRSRRIDLHKMIGITVTSLLVLQIWLGYRHHIVYVKFRKQSAFTTLHLWLGRSILCLGIFNIGMGMFYAGLSTSALSLWFVAVVAEFTGYFYIMYKHNRRKHLGSGKREPSLPHPEADKDNCEVEAVPLVERETE